MITILQEPLGLTPTNAEHIYTFSSSLYNNPNYTNFKYVVDVWFRPNTDPEKVVRLKIYPNEYGVGIVDVGEILTTYIKGNPRSETAQGAGWNTATLSPYTADTYNGLISNARYVSNQNAYNEDNVYDPYYQIEEYRLMIGEQFTEYGDDTILIPGDVSVYPSSLVVFNGTGSTISWSGAAVNQIVQTGNTINWQVYTGSTSTTSPVASGYYTGSSQSNVLSSLSYSSGNTLVITEIYSNIKFYYVSIGSSWLFVEKVLPDMLYSYEVINYGGIFMPYQKQIWPGRQINTTNFNYNRIDNQYWSSGNTYGTNNHLFYEAYKYQFTGFTYQSISAPALFLNNFGDDLSTFSYSGDSSTRIRHRKHHYECPIVLSFFNKKNLLYTNNSIGITATIVDNNSVVGFDTYQFDYTAPYTDFWYNPSEILQTYTNIFDNHPGKQIYLNTYDDNGERNSEWVRYDLSDMNCLSTPIHFLYLNSNGVWDTLTFDRKSTKTFNIKRDIYAQTSNLNKPLYNRLSTDARKVVYNLDVVETIMAQSDFADENDRVLFEEFYMSPEAYMIREHEQYNVPYQNKTPYLIPINILSNSVERYKSRYNKLYQYTFNFEFNPIKLYRTSY